MGNGIYTIPDIALILKLPGSKVSRWLNDFWNTRIGEASNKKYSYGEGRNKVTDFYTLIEFYIFYQLREQGVSAKKILEAHAVMEKQLNTPYPFASAKVLTDGSKMMYSLEDGTTVNADKSNQIILRDIILSFCKKIDFSETQLAQRFWPMGKDHNIIVDPQHKYGQPTIEKTNVLASTIYDLYKAGDSTTVLMRLFNLSSEAVNDAILFYEPLIKSVA